MTPAQKLRRIAEINAALASPVTTDVDRHALAREIQVILGSVTAPPGYLTAVTDPREHAIAFCELFPLADDGTMQQWFEVAIGAGQAAGRQGDERRADAYEQMRALLGLIRDGLEVGAIHSRTVTYGGLTRPLAELVVDVLQQAAGRHD